MRRSDHHPRTGRPHRVAQRDTRSKRIEAGSSSEIPQASKTARREKGHPAYGAHHQEGRLQSAARVPPPFDGAKCVDQIITNLAVFTVDEKQGLTLTEVAPGETIESVREATEAPFEVAV